MHRNTYLLVIFLAIVAALVAGVNIGQSLTKTSSLQKQVTLTPRATATPIPTDALYNDPTCDLSLTYPIGFNRLENGSGSALLVSPVDSSDVIIITCQKNIARPQLPASKIDELSISSTGKSASVAAKLYHGIDGTTGSFIDRLYFQPPSLGLDVMIAGYGDTFNQIIKTIKILK